MVLIRYHYQTFVQQLFLNQLPKSMLVENSRTAFQKIENSGKMIQASFTRVAFMALPIV